MVRMDEYCSSVRDGTHDTPKPTSDGKYLVTSKAIHDNTIDFSSCYFISQKDFDKINARSKVDEWDVLMTMIGSVGRLLLVQNEPDYAIKNIALFKIGNEDKAKWLYFYLSNKPVQDYFEAIASGTSQHFIGLGHLRKLKIADFNENSKKVVSILSAYDNLIENNNKRIKILEQMAENLYKEWFVRFRFPGHETTPFENGIPKGWSINRFDTAASLINGRAYLMPELLSEGKYRIVRVGNFSGKNEWFYSDMELESDKYCEQGDLLYKWACNFGPEIWNEEKVIYHYHIWKVVPKNNVNKAYLYFYLKTSTPLWMGGTNGTAMVHITKESMEKKKMVVPPESILDQFDNIVGPMIRNRLSLQKHNENLIKQRDLLLPRLMSGKLAV